MAQTLTRDGYRLLWADEFTGTALDRSAWNYETGHVRNNELQFYTDDGSNAVVEDGRLTLLALRHDEGAPHRYTSASITTQHKFSFTYGIVEIHARLPWGRGIWPAFWLMGDERGRALGDYSWPACGEVDILEMVGGGRVADATVHSTLHWGTREPYRHLSLDEANPHSYRLAEGIFADGFHLFSLKWTPQAMVWHVDGQEYLRAAIDRPGMEMFHRPFFILLNLAVGGNWPGDPDGHTVFPQRYEIDYVRVYQQEKQEVATC